MNNHNFRFLSIILITGLLSFYQFYSPSFLGVKPNWALIAVIVSLFFAADFWEALLVIALSSFILKFAPGFEEELLIFPLTGAALFVLMKQLPLYPFVSNLLMIGIGTAVFYLFLARAMIFSRVFSVELLMNLVIGALLFALFRLLWQNEINKISIN